MTRIVKAPFSNPLMQHTHTRQGAVGQRIRRGNARNLTWSKAAIPASVSGGGERREPPCSTAASSSTPNGSADVPSGQARDDRVLARGAGSSGDSGTRPCSNIDSRCELPTVPSLPAPGVLLLCPPPPLPPLPLPLLSPPPVDDADGGGGGGEGGDGGGLGWRLSPTLEAVSTEEEVSIVEEEVEK